MRTRSGLASLTAFTTASVRTAGKRFEACRSVIWATLKPSSSGGRFLTATVIGSTVGSESAFQVEVMPKKMPKTATKHVETIVKRSRFSTGSPIFLRTSPRTPPITSRASASRKNQ